MSVSEAVIDLERIIKEQHASIVELSNTLCTTHAKLTRTEAALARCKEQRDENVGEPEPPDAIETYNAELDSILTGEK